MLAADRYDAYLFLSVHKVYTMSVLLSLCGLLHGKPVQIECIAEPSAGMVRVVV